MECNNRMNRTERLNRTFGTNETDSTTSDNDIENDSPTQNILLNESESTTPSYRASQVDLTLEQQLEPFLNNEQARAYLIKVYSMEESMPELYENILSILKLVKLDRLWDDGQVIARLMQIFNKDDSGQQAEMIEGFIAAFLEPQDVE